MKHMNKMPESMQNEQILISNASDFSYNSIYKTTTDQRCKNSKEQATDWKNIKEILISFSFTVQKNTNYSKIVQDRLQTQWASKRRTRLRLAAEDVKQLLQFTATSTDFMFRDTIYKQKDGFNVEDLEEKAVNYSTRGA